MSGTGRNPDFFIIFVDDLLGSVWFCLLILRLGLGSLTGIWVLSSLADTFSVSFGLFKGLAGVRVGGVGLV